MRRRSEPDTDTEAVEPDDQVVAAPVQVSGPDIFVKPRPPRRDLLPASLRRGRHGAKDARRAAARANHPCQGSARMYLVDGEGEYEEARIAIRSRFEALSLVDAPPKTEESAAG